MAKKFLVSINLNQNELQNARIQNLATPPASPAEGQIYFDTTAGDKSIYFWDGTTWIDVGGDLRSVSAGTGISVTGTRDLTVSAIFDNSSIGVNGSNQLIVKAAGVTNAMLVNSSLSISAGSGLTGGGSVSLGGSTTLNIGAGTGITVNANDVALDTSSTRNTDHATITLTAGNGLTGGGNITASRTFDVGAGVGITVAADTVAVAGAATLTANVLSKWNGTAFANSTISDNGTTVTIGGNLTVNGTVSYINSNTVEIGDNIILLNRDEVGAPTQDAGFEIERGTSTNVSFLWNETSDYWSTVDQAFHIGSIASAGAGYSGNAYLVGHSGVVKSLTAAELAADVATGFTFTEGNGIDISGSGTASITISAESASTTNEGIVELAIASETRLLSSSTLAVTPASLAGLRHAVTGPATAVTTMPVTHNLGSLDVIVQVYELATGETIECDVLRTDINIVTLNFAVAPIVNSLRVLVIKIA